MNTVAIVGVGLIGGSFGLALRNAGFQGEIIGVSSPAALAAGLRSGAISTTATLAQAAARADLIYLAQPVDRILQTLKQLGPLAPAHCLITDAGSTKTAIVHMAAQCVQTATFLGGHPIAGKEVRGAEAAEPELFRGRPYVLTPVDPAPSPASLNFRLWLQRIGADVIEMSAEHHDATLAFTSHLPQLLSSALAATLAREPNPNILRVFGTGLLDMTRLALSPPDLWLSILCTNKLHINAALESLIEVLMEVKLLVQTDEITDLLHSGAAVASQLRSGAQQTHPDPPPGTFPY
jgi:prephenate dehydrogenase